MPEKRKSVSGGSRRGTHRRRGLKRRIKHLLHKYRWLGPCALIALVIVVAGAAWMITSVSRQQAMRVTAASQFNIGSGYRDITYQGKSYRYNSRITSILYAGVDSDEPLTRLGKFTMAPRADSISLVVLDEFHHRMTVIALNRDTMTPIRKYTLDGFDRGMIRDHLGYAYTYGDGGEISCRNVCEAVSELLYGIPVNEYVVTNRASLETMAEIVGDVTVTVPNDDLADEGFSAGTQAVIDASNIEAFVRSRDTARDLSNVGRMARQQAYINGAVEQIRNLVFDDPSGAWRRMEAAEDFMQTNITRSRYLDLARVLKNTTYDERDYFTPEGEQRVAEDHDRFYPDEEALLAKVIEIFYIEK